MNQNGGEEREMTAGGRGGLRMTAWGIENVEGFENDCVSKVSTQICTLFRYANANMVVVFFSPIANVSDGRKNHFILLDVFKTASL